MKLSVPIPVNREASLCIHIGGNMCEALDWEKLAPNRS